MTKKELVEIAIHHKAEIDRLNEEIDTMKLIIGLVVNDKFSQAISVLNAGRSKDPS